MELLYKKDSRGCILWRANLTKEEVAHPELLPSADLSRKKHGGCIFRADKLADHDGHAPSRFANKAELDAYIARVVNDFKLGQAKVGGWNVAGEVNVCSSTMK